MTGTRQINNTPSRGADIKRALIAMSGGVDSSVAASLMMSRGYECIGVTMKLFGNEDISVPAEHSCCSADDVEDARRVCVRLGIPHYVMNFTEDFAQAVIRRFVESYEKGLTPNPCIDCNRYLKFDRLYRRAMELGCEKVVTGHYARVCYDSERGRWLLKKSLNQKKDQSYVLAFLTQEQLAHTYFPLGDYDNKEEIRGLAEEAGFENSGKPDSQDICFVPDNDYASFIRGYTGKDYPPGDFVNDNGDPIGQHKGIICYTIGQRRGLGLSLPAPLYVSGKDTENNIVRLSPNEKLYSSRLTARDFNWISMEEPESGRKIRVSGRTRYNSRETQATAQMMEDGRVLVDFDQPVRAITPGQALVLYDGDIVVGGGTICE